MLASSLLPPPALLPSGSLVSPAALSGSFGLYLPAWGSSHQACLPGPGCPSRGSVLSDHPQPSPGFSPLEWLLGSLHSELTSGARAIGLLTRLPPRTRLVLKAAFLKAQPVITQNF